MIIDPHSALWESDLIVVVHDVSNEYSRDKLDSEVLKCLFAHPDKEAILVLNKTDRLKHKGQLLGLVASLTGGRLNGKEFMESQLDRNRKKNYTRNSLRDDEYEELFVKTAKAMNIPLVNTKLSKKQEQVVSLLEELRTCEDYLIKNQEKIYVSEDRNDRTRNSDLVSLIFLSIKISNCRHEYKIHADHFDHFFILIFHFFIVIFHFDHFFILIFFILIFHFFILTLLIISRKSRVLPETFIIRD